VGAASGHAQRSPYLPSMGTPGGHAAAGGPPCVSVEVSGPPLGEAAVHVLSNPPPPLVPLSAWPANLSGPGDGVQTAARPWMG